MSDDEENLCCFGTPLEPLEEDEIPLKKPIAVEDQIVTDSNGRRRFHGAFTGGFSAGFWNTVGSLEGWTPQDYSSSRTERAKQLEQKPIDFMDDEDLGEFGFAPQRVQTTDDFTPQEIKDAAHTRKRKLQQPSGPIPGVPVLHQLLKPPKDNVAMRLLKKMGWKIGQGIGARQTKKEKRLASARNAREEYIMKKYGCDIGPLANTETEIENDSETSSEGEEITFAPDDFDPYVCAIKDNTFGLGYSGLSRSNQNDEKPEHVNLFGNAFEVLGKGNKKLSIRGQAFGVGALEEDDEDIYAADDLTKYDFSLEDKKKEKKLPKENKRTEMCIEGFCMPKNETLTSQKKIFTINLPHDFKPRNWAVRRSRFEPLSEERLQVLKKKEEYKVKGLGRHDLNPEQRKTILEGSSAEEKNLKQQLLTDKKNFDETIKKEIIRNDDEILDKEIREENEKIQNKAQKLTEKLPKVLPTKQDGGFKPFSFNLEKQQRYEKFIEANLQNDEEITKFLMSLQPLSMTDWDRELEKKEFLQARKIYKPLQGIMLDRFVSETTILAKQDEVKEAKSKSTKNLETIVTRQVWKPSLQLCKRFNIPEPYGGTIIQEKKNDKKSKFSVFDYLEASINKKTDFVTPVILPKKNDKPLPIISQNTQNTSSEVEYQKTLSEHNKNARLSSTDYFKNEDNNLINLTQSTPSNTVNKKQISSKPKSELERKVEATKNKHPSEKKDLYKSIFEDSSDEEFPEKSKEEDNNIKSDFITVNTNASADANNIPKDIYTALTKSATEVNILRNTSPPRGIFANLFTRKSEKDSSKDQQSINSNFLEKISENTDEKGTLKNLECPVITKEPDNLYYGPKLPEKSQETHFVKSIDISSNSSSSTDSETEESNLNKKLLEKLRKNKSEYGKRNDDAKGEQFKMKIIENWVEKTKLEKKKKSKKEKRKKSKKHHKRKKDKKSKR